MCQALACTLSHVKLRTTPPRRCYFESSCHRWGNWGKERWGICRRVTKVVYLAHDRAGFWARSSWKPILCPISSTVLAGINNFLSVFLETGSFKTALALFSCSFFSPFLSTDIFLFLPSQSFLLHPGLFCFPSLAFLHCLLKLQSKFQLFSSLCP